MAKKPKLNAETKQSTRDRIISAAEELFATKGMHGASLREIARKAAINVNLISYYFSEKEELYNAVVDERGALLHEARSISLDALEAQHSPEPVPVVEIIRSLIHPYFELRANDPSGWNCWIQLLQKEAGTELLNRAMTRNLSIVLRRYINCLHRSVPNADRSDLLFVLMVAIRSMILGSEWSLGEAVPGSDNDNSDKRTEERIVRAATAAALAFGER